MANRSLFSTLFPRWARDKRVVNDVGGVAYERSTEQALAQLAATGCLSNTFYASAEVQLKRMVDLANQVTPEFVAQTAIYARERGHMKDMPALLLASLSRRDPALMDRVFDRVVDTPRMLRTFVQIVRSGATGRRSLGSAPKRCVRRWLDQRTEAAIFAASVGQSPSLADVLKMVHPKPATPERDALYGYLLGRQIPAERLPDVAHDYEDFKCGRRSETPDVPFQLLTALPLTREHWLDVARRAPWHMTRMNLSTFARHGVFTDRTVTRIVADRLRDPQEIARARVFPYQLLAAYRAADANVPREVSDALGDAMEFAVANVPAIDGQVYVCPDVSGSMRSPITGRRDGATTKVRCVDAAALIAAAVMRKNRTAEVLPFDWNVREVRLNPRDAVTTNADKLAAGGGGGTAVSAPITWLNRQKAKAELVVIVSDNESWYDKSMVMGTVLMQEWTTFVRRNPRARLVLIDLQPNMTTQLLDREDVLNIGGFSDTVFDLVADFAAGRCSGNYWVDTIARVPL